MVDAAIYLRRPLLVTGRPGTGKSSLAYLISRELGLGPALRWSITSRTTLKEGRPVVHLAVELATSGGIPARPRLAGFAHSNLAPDVFVDHGDLMSGLPLDDSPESAPGLASRAAAFR